MKQPIWNFEQDPSDEPMDETSINLRAYFDRMDDEKMKRYRPDWTDEQVIAWDGNFRDDGHLMILCCERDVDVAEYREVLEQCINYRNRVRPHLFAKGQTANTEPDDEDSSQSPLVGRTLSHYHVVSLLGAGGMGEVYLARDPRLDRFVALKILPPELAFDADRLQRFVREAKAASALNHPNVATIHDIGESKGVRFLAMEYVEGHTLAEKIAGRPVAAADIVEIAAQVADALDAAHAKGITHRDIKPANLMLTPHGQVKVLDFGVAKRSRTESSIPIGELSTGAKTAAGMLIGSVPYMSPEQVLGREVDHRSDLFSLGVALYEMATGRLPFPARTTPEMTDRILHAQPDSITRVNGDIPSELERITLKCLEKEVERRYQSARELLVDLRQLKRQMNAGVTGITIGEARHHNLPAQLTSFVGRCNEIAETRRLLATTRLLTLTGAGGCGKTRLALQVTADLLDQFPDGVWVVDLAPLSEPSLVTHTVAAVLGVREGPDGSLGDRLVEYFRPRRVLLMLDNCEHLVAECAQFVAPLLRAAANLHILATSREVLGIPGEIVLRVPSLSGPAPSDLFTPEALLQYEAVRLFADRAVAVEPAFTITKANAATVAEICRRLDGIPLAIELAAARLKVLSVDQINVRLKDRFRLLTGGSRTAVARQRTLEATIDWSYDLLSEAERRLLCRLSVFPGGWTLEAAEEVCSGNDIHKETILDLLSQLVDKSLVNVEDDTGGDRRYRCLETVRQYGRDRLVRSGDAERVRDRHLDYFLTLVRRAEPELIRADQASWLNRLQFDYANLRTALEWCLEASRHSEVRLEFATALAWFWTKRGYLAEGRQWLEHALTAGSGASFSLQAKALNGLGLMAFFQGDYASTPLLLEKSLTLAREVDDQGEAAWSLGLQALVAMETGDVARSAKLATECQDAAMASGEPWRQGPALECLAYQAVHEGDYDRACRLTEKGLELSRRTGDTWAIGIQLYDLALFRVLEGRYAQAEVMCAQGITLCQNLADRLVTAYFLGILAAAQAAQDRDVHAARLWGAMQSLLESVASPPQESYKTLIGDRYMGRVKESLGETAFHAALSEGRAMSLTQAVQHALAKTS